MTDHPTNSGLDAELAQRNPFAHIVHSEVHLTRHVFYPGEPIEGYVTIHAKRSFVAKNIHIKIAGEERVVTNVVEVQDSKTPNCVQYGVSAQDYAYYREVVTLAGDLLTWKRPENAGNERGDGAPSSRGQPGAIISPTDDDVISYLGSITDDQLQRSFAGMAQSFAAAAAGGYIQFPQGTYTYPFRFFLPAHLPPRFQTGLHVRDGQFSQSKASLDYFVKVYVQSRTRELSTSRTDFEVCALRPVLPSPVPGSRVVECHFPIAGCCLSCCCGCGWGGSSDSTMKVLFTLQQQVLEAGRDAIHVKCSFHNNSSRPVTSMEIQLLQNLTFSTSVAGVTMTVPALTADLPMNVAPEADGEFQLTTAVIGEQTIPNIRTTGLEVSYSIRVRLVCADVEGSYYDFDKDIIIVGKRGASSSASVEPEGLPSGEMVFEALPRGRLTSREAFYCVPPDPPISAKLPILEQSSVVQTPAPSRWVSAAPSPVNEES